MQMYNPADPGAVLRELYLEPLQLTISEAAEALGVNRNTIADLIKGRSRVSTPMALRLAKAFGTTAELWLNMQQNYDLWMARKKVSLTNVKVLFSAEPSFSH